VIIINFSASEITCPNPIRINFQNFRNQLPDISDCIFMQIVSEVKSAGHLEQTQMLIIGSYGIHIKMPKTGLNFNEFIFRSVRGIGRIRRIATENVGHRLGRTQHGRGRDSLKSLRLIISDKLLTYLRTIHDESFFVSV
jgi:hypothetical protein